VCAYFSRADNRDEVAKATTEAALESTPIKASKQTTPEKRKYIQDCVRHAKRTIAHLSIIQPISLQLRFSISGPVAEHLILKTLMAPTYVYFLCTFALKNVAMVESTSLLRTFHSNHKFEQFQKMFFELKRPADRQ
jgi:hypothetical protein